MLTLLGDAAGLPPLLSYWRKHGRKDDNWTRLVFRAVAALGDDSQVPILEEIYRGFAPNAYKMREFYWTIRTLEGPHLKLRKKMRQEIGMDRLR